MNYKNICFLAFMLIGTMGFSQTESPENWFNLDPQKDNVPGVSTEETYKKLLAGKQGEIVVVAVIDSGVDSEHEDLKDVMWTNPGEIAGNNIDDDGNGYIDDIHGWNFIGGKNGNVNHEALEITRLVRFYKKKYDGRSMESLSKKEKVEYAKYQEMAKIVNDKAGETEGVLANLNGTLNALLAAEKGIKGEVTPEKLQAFESDDEQTKALLTQMASVMTSQGVSFKDLKENLESGVSHYEGQMKYYYNVDFDPRDIVGDNYSNSYQVNYGNNDVQGPDAGHGTHVAGIIGAVRTNNIGIKGVADNVRIMSVRAVPDGDERDKDVAAAIRYAVDNGASVINMSFGKSYSWDKKVVDAAVKYATKHDVLMVHAAGNDGKNTDVASNFPSDDYLKAGLFKSKMSKTWLEIGASTYKNGEDAPASFSNYGKTHVDLFAPGYQILSTIPDGGYAKFSGTSMAAPVTAGVAAMLRSYFPKLSAEQVKEILMASVIKNNGMVNKPGSDEKINFSDLSITGGVVNSFKAVELATKTKGKRKMNKTKIKTINPGRA